MGVNISYSPIKKHSFKTKIGHRSSLARQVRENTYHGQIDNATALDYLKSGDFPEFWAEVELLVQKHGAIIIHEDW